MLLEPLVRGTRSSLGRAPQNCLHFGIILVFEIVTLHRGPKGSILSPHARENTRRIPWQ